MASPRKNPVETLDAEKATTATAAEIIEHFQGYGFTDSKRHQLENCQPFQQLVELALDIATHLTAQSHGHQLAARCHRRQNQNPIYTRRAAAIPRRRRAAHTENFERRGRFIMELESAVKYFSPKGMSISDEPRATASDCLTGTDLMGAIGMCQSKANFGMAAFLAKTGVSSDDRERAIAALLGYAHRTAPKLVIKAAGSQLGKCLVVLSKLAFEEYCRSAATISGCPHCAGRGYHVERRQVVIYSGYISPFGDEEKISARYELQDVRENCSVCKGKGKITARCRCNGTGRVRDLTESERQGVPVDRECERCSGRGYKRMPASRAYRAISVLLPELQERTWNRNWKPFFEKLVAECEIEESHADAEFRKITQ